MRLSRAHFFLGFVRQGRFDEASAEFLKARELDPLASDVARGVAIPYYLKRDYTKAFELLQQASRPRPALQPHVGNRKQYSKWENRRGTGPTG